MINIGNTTPVTNNDQLSPNKPSIKQPAPTPQVSDVVHKPFVERRRGDRRKDRKDNPHLDSRSGKDRRRRPSIDIKA